MFNYTGHLINLCQKEDCKTKTRHVHCPKSGCALHFTTRSALITHMWRCMFDKKTTKPNMTSKMCTEEELTQSADLPHPQSVLNDQVL